MTPVLNHHLWIIALPTWYPAFLALPALTTCLQHLPHTVRCSTFPGAIERIQDLKRDGYRIVLITGSLDFLVAPLAAVVGAGKEGGVHSERVGDDNDEKVDDEKRLMMLECWVARLRGHTVWCIWFFTCWFPFVVRITDLHDFIWQMKSLRQSS